jgi:hypothetical protein
MKTKMKSDLLFCRTLALYIKFKSGGQDINEEGYFVAVNPDISDCAYCCNLFFAEYTAVSGHA